MSESLGIVYHRKTGHALGAVTRSAKADDKIPAEQLTSAGVLVRGPFEDTDQDVTSFEIGPENLGVVVLATDHNVLLAPRQYGVAPLPEDDNEGQPKEPEEVINLSATPNHYDDDKTELNTGQMRVVLEEAVTSKTNIWVQIEGGDLQDAISAFSSIEQGADEVTLNLPQVLTAGSKYDLLLLIQNEPVEVLQKVANGATPS